ncbi:hypothetical protein ACNKHO_11160 [Shigella flexneri]
MRYFRFCIAFLPAALAESDIADGQTRRFDFNVLQSIAHNLSASAVERRARALPDTLANS